LTVNTQPHPDYWTYAEIGQEFGLSARTVRQRMPAWESEGFPAPLPWSLREKRWNPQAVQNWRSRRETRLAGQRPPLTVVR